jgi:P-aminobenzoate N-oxygenase AurF
MRSGSGERMTNVMTVALRGMASPVDFGRKFMPENLTALYYAPAYRRLAPRHRLRYNQLQALFFNEQVIFFETMVGTGVMEGLLRLAWADGFGDKVRRFADDEIRHTEMFRRLNRRCAPQFYGAADFHFIHAPARGVAALRRLTRHPRLFPLFIWLMLLQEERSLYYSREFIRQGADLEAQFVACHRAHLADEVRHVHWDQVLLDRLWGRAGRLLRAVNARLFAWMMGEFFSAPRRGQVQVIASLVREFPELAAQEGELRRQLARLPEDEAYQLSLYSRDIVPQCFARFDQSPELRVMQRALRGYRVLAEAPR